MALTIRDTTLDFEQKTYVMGILNCTPDSFYEASRQMDRTSAIAAANDMIDCGVDIIDVGGESTRPGSASISVEEEIERVCPIIEAIRKSAQTVISIDTTKARVAEEALERGADIVNDISGLRFDTEMRALIAARDVPVVVMHIRGTPETMQDNPYYEDTIEEIKVDLQGYITAAIDAGISRDKIIVDPGIGFGKRLEDNLRIVKLLPRLKELGFPVLIGISRKSFLGKIVDKPAEERLVATVTANTMAVLNGADIVRVHDYREAIDMRQVIEAIEGVNDR